MAEKMKTKPPEGYTPTMTFKTKCQYCRQAIKVLGWHAFNEALEKHRETCKEPEKKR